MNPWWLLLIVPVTAIVAFYIGGVIVGKAVCALFEPFFRGFKR